MEAIVFTMTPWPISSDHMDSMIEDAWMVAIEFQYCQQAFACAPVATPSECQLPGGPPRQINL